MLAEPRRDWSWQKSSPGFPFSVLQSFPVSVKNPGLLFLHSLGSTRGWLWCLSRPENGTGAGTGVLVFFNSSGCVFVFLNPPGLHPRAQAPRARCPPGWHQGGATSITPSGFWEGKQRFWAFLCQRETC